jgi:hypothetical protein
MDATDIDFYFGWGLIVGTAVGWVITVTALLMEALQ